MSYTTDIAATLTAQLAKFMTLNRHQLAGQVANLDFWVNEVRHVLAVIDGYPDRFDHMTRAQQAYVAEHDVREIVHPRFSDTIDWKSPEKTRRVPHGPMQEARTQLCDTFYRLLVHVFRAGFINESTVRRTSQSLGIGVESRDLKNQR